MCTIGSSDCRAGAKAEVVAMLRGERDMTELLQRAFAEIEKLPADAQDAVATRSLADWADEQAWTERFEATSPGQWNRLAEMARREIAQGETIPIEDAFRFKATEG